MCQDRRSLGMNIPGLLRERAAIPAQFAWTAPDGLTEQDLVCVEPMTVVLHAARLSKADDGNALPYRRRRVARALAASGAARHRG